MGEWIGTVCVEPGRYQQPVGGEALHHRDHHGVQRIPVGVAGSAGRKGQVDGRPGARPLAHLVGRTGARVQRPLVARDVQHPVIRGEGVLGPVPMVGVDVDDGHPLAAIG